MKIKLLLLLLTAIAMFVVFTLYQAGSFKNIESHSEMRNHFIYTQMAGTEDIAIDRANERLIISSADRWNKNPGLASQDGIYLLDLNVNASPVKMKTTFAGELHPHGISFFTKGGNDYLFVVNHSQSGSSVETFKIEQDTLIHLQTFQSDEMCCPNDVVAVDVDKFYVSNDHGAESGLGRTLEDYLKIANAYVLYVDGNHYSRVYENLNYANGINVSADGETVYVTEVSTGKLSVLNRDVATGTLELRFIKDLNTGLDNITIDNEGNLWVAAHPKLLDFVSHAKYPGSPSPSQVLKLTPSANDDFFVDEIYMNDGEELSGSSSALYYNGQVFIGVVFENKLLRGEYP